MGSSAASMAAAASDIGKPVFEERTELIGPTGDWAVTAEASDIIPVSA